MNTREIGAYAERLAAEYLTEQGYEIITLNFLYKNLGEIDIIARIDNTYVFVEVRYRKSIYYGLPEATLGEPKLRKIRKTATVWRLQHGVHRVPCRFDVIGIDLHRGKPEIRHLKDCF